MKVFKLVVSDSYVSVLSAIFYFKEMMTPFNCLDYFKERSSDFASFLASHPCLEVSSVRMKEFEDNLVCILRVDFYGEVETSVDEIRLTSSLYVYSHGKN